VITLKNNVLVQLLTN